MLDGVELFDACHGFVGFAPTGLLRLDEPPPRMRPAADLDDRSLRLAEEFVVTGVGITLEIAAEVRQESERPIAATQFGSVENGAMFGDGDPDSAGAAVLAVTIEGRSGRASPAIRNVAERSCKAYASRNTRVTPKITLSLIPMTKGRESPGFTALSQLGD